MAKLAGVAVSARFSAGAGVVAAGGEAIIHPEFKPFAYDFRFGEGNKRRVDGDFLFILLMIFKKKNVYG